jgi:hypothetical protein
MKCSEIIKYITLLNLVAKGGTLLSIENYQLIDSSVGNIMSKLLTTLTIK